MKSTSTTLNTVLNSLSAMNRTASILLLVLIAVLFCVLSEAEY
jgi:hypothetical protein